MAQPQKLLPVSSETVRARRSQLFNTILPGTIVRRRGDGKVSLHAPPVQHPNAWFPCLFAVFVAFRGLSRRSVVANSSQLAEVLSTAAWPSTWITVRLRDTGAVVKLRGASAFTIPGAEAAAAARKRAKPHASLMFSCQTAFAVCEHNNSFSSFFFFCGDPTGPLFPPISLMYIMRLRLLLALASAHGPACRHQGISRFVVLRRRPSMAKGSASSTVSP
jgi:hypothetical protein